MQAEKAVQIAGKRYEVGKGTVLELNTSQVQLTEAELLTTNPYMTTWWLRPTLTRCWEETISSVIRNKTRTTI